MQRKYHIIYEYTIFTISANIVKLNTINAKEMPFNLLNIIFTSSTNIVKKKILSMHWKYHTIYSTLLCFL
jgi:hypothetical protein